MQASELKSLADAPGTSREYETIYIVRPNMSNEGVADVNERVRGIIENMGGKIIKVDNWGKRRLAYEVKKERKGIYLHWQYLATQGIVEELERNMRMLDAVIRYMTVKLDKDVDPTARPTEVDEETYERAATTAADEEDMYLARGAEGEEEGEEEGKGEEAKEAKGEEAKEGKGEEAKEGKGEEAKEAKGEEAKETKGEEAKETQEAKGEETKGEGEAQESKEQSEETSTTSEEE